ncbi:UNVERIFIED_CONTAM: Major allergen Pru ar 1 [Sesamum radiatum]|uniref:Major allergen Pru ar 1 n=1 Tax=Sesamum radiatum TaxID=300843 RepID=A0AAW2QG40_SESRA
MHAGRSSRCSWVISNQREKRCVRDSVKAWLVDEVDPNTWINRLPLLKSIETVGGGDSVGVGCIRQTNFPDGIHAIDTENYACQHTLIERDALEDKLEEICYEIKFEASEDGGCVLKLTSEYHTKGDVELNDDEIKAGKKQAMGLYKAREEYLAANPDVCT